MQIRTRLSIRFSIIVNLILIIFSIAIYLISANNRADAYYNALKSRALTEAKLYSRDVKEVDTALLRIIDKSRNNISNAMKVTAVYDGTGKLVYKFPLEAEAPLMTGDLIIKLIENKEIKSTVNKNQQAWEYYEGRAEHLLVYVNGYDASGYQKLHYLAWVLVICCNIAVIVTFISAYFYPLHLIAPIKYMVDLVEEISVSSLDLRLPVGKNNDEIDRLAITFNDMLQRLEESFVMQRDFISNASHELRTPIGVMTVQIEVALMGKRTPEEYKKTLTSLLEDLKNLRSMMNGLLELTEANMQPSSIKLLPMRIDELVWQAKSDLAKQHPDYHILLNYAEIPENQEKLIIPGNEFLKTAVMNIMNNGCKYSANKTVSVFLESKNNLVTLTFKDNGIGIPPEELKNIFHPFFRGSNAKAFPGNGLGLALSLKIIELHKGKLIINSTEDKFTTVTVVLPNKAG
jgi:signal transduction histidine kinase